MALVTGSLLDFGFASLGAASGRIVFIPSSPATGSGTANVAQLLSDRPIITVPDPVTGLFSIDLYPNTNTRPNTWYTVRIDWMDASGGFVGSDYLGGALVVGVTGGNIRDQMRNGISGSECWVVPGAALPLDSVPGDMLFDPNNSNLYILS